MMYTPGVSVFTFTEPDTRLSLTSLPVPVKIRQLTTPEDVANDSVVGLGYIQVEVDGTGSLVVVRTEISR